MLIMTGQFIECGTNRHFCFLLNQLLFFRSFSFILLFLLFDVECCTTDIFLYSCILHIVYIFTFIYFILFMLDLDFCIV